ncbi:TrmH family RNA methyltransferase [Enterococcus sp. CSURQ0835]|uniref:TrmH family RNA methyltransferase n=1 Tax=Enterococcus sp. CSURQ0835 TaxID=2681394 RepID=UPI0013579DA3|nr:RNA methyltransferase [Enterococcus sp. CSURQ0835]
MKEISSVKNQVIKEAKKLQQKKYRLKAGAYLLEGFHLIEEAVKAGSKLQALFVSARGVSEWQEWLETFGEEYYLVTDEVLKTLATEKTPQGMIAVCELPTEAAFKASGSWLLLDTIQDPGNLGTMIRTADAAGLTGVILGSGTVDLYNPKTLRSMQGSQFHLPIISRELAEVIEEFKASDVPVYGSALDQAAVIFSEVAPQTDFALIMGNEGNGMQPELLKVTDQNLYIPIKGAAESLNVAVAAGILLFQLNR